MGQRHCLDACTVKLNLNKEEGGTFIWEVDNFDKKWPPRREKKKGQHSTWSEDSPQSPPTVHGDRTPAAKRTLGPTPASSAQARRLAELGPTPLSAPRRSPGTRPLQPESATCAGFSAWPLGGPCASKVAVATVGSLSLSPRAQPRSLDSRGGGGSERPRPLPRGGSATIGCGRRLCCNGGCAFRSAQPGSDPEPERASPPSPPPLRRPRSGSSSRRDAFDPPSPDLRISGGEEFCLGPYEHLSAFLPLPSRLPHPVGARAHTHSHSQARVRTPARPEPRSLQRPSADPCSLGRRYSHRLPAATGRPLSAAAATAAAEGTAAAARPRLSAPCPGQSPGEAEKGEDAEAERSRAAPGARLRAAGCLRSSYRGPRGERMCAYA
nr:serine/arginine repetitive matrix protein 1-like [Microcebus murinus]